MPQVVNTNITALNAQRNLSSSQSSLSVSMQRLSSGLRVNSAKDDAAGLAIAERRGRPRAWRWPVGAIAAMAVLVLGGVIWAQL